MKNLVLLLAGIFVLSSFTVLPQSKDTTKIKIGKKKIIVIDDDNKSTEINFDSAIVDIDIDTTINVDRDDEDECCESEFEGHWHGFEFGLNNYLTSDNKMLNDKDNMSLNGARSWSFYLNILQYSLPIVHDNFGIITGLGLEWDSYSFDKDITLSNKDDITSFEVEETEFTKNKLRTSYLTAPIMFEYQTQLGNDEDDKFWVGAGVLAGLKIGSSTIQEWKEGSSSYEKKCRNDFNINPFKMALTARMGYKDFGLFANYNITPLFKDNRGPIEDELFPVQIGVKIIGF